jgi:4-coumarate--CoA ligase
MGYLNNKQATRETFDTQGWLHTGDVGLIDSEGFITITDRIKEMIKVKGIAVAPAELEDLLLGHSAVEDVAVCGIPDDYSGQRTKAYVVLKPGLGNQGSQESMTTLGRQLIDYVRERKIRHKWINEIEIVDEIPKSASGKTLRRMLRRLENEASKERLVIKRAEPHSKL